jgi:hypothetical protein
MIPRDDHPSDWQVLMLEDGAETLVADLVPLAAQQTGLLSLRLGVEDRGERDLLRECLQRCADASVPLTLRWVDGDTGSVLLLTTEDGMLVVTACDRP